MKLSRFISAASVATAAALAVVSAVPAGASTHSNRVTHGGSTTERRGSVRPAPFTVGGPRKVHASYGAGFATSSNWSGWVDTGNTYTWLMGTWNVPTVYCSPGEYSSSFTWDGLDGNTDNTVEQVGTYQDCVNGSPNYGGWWEMFTTAYGSPAIPLSSPQPSSPDGMKYFNYWGDSSSYPVRPGDTMEGFVSNWNGSGTTYSLYIINETENWYFLAEVSPPSNWRPAGSANGSSAEWIVEQPTNWVGNTLTHYSMVTFNNAETYDGSYGAINAFPNNMIWMTSDGTSNGYLKALTSFGLNNNGYSFNDGWIRSS